MSTGTLKLYTHLNFDGKCREAFHFYEEHLGGKVEYSQPTPKETL